jgi:WD40 repeat protein
LDGKIKIWNETSFNNESLLTIDYRCPITTLENSLEKPDILISGSENGQISIWNLTNGSLENSIEAHTSSVLVLRLSKYTFNELASGSSDNKLKIWNLNETSELIFQINETNKVFCIEYLSKTIIAYCAKNFVKIYDLALKSLINSHSFLSSLVGIYLIDNNFIVTGNNQSAYSILFNISNTTNFTKYNHLDVCMKSADIFINNGKDLPFVGCGSSLRKWPINSINAEGYSNSYVAIKVLDYPFMAVGSKNENHSIQIFNHSLQITAGPRFIIKNAHQNEITSIKHIPKDFKIFENKTINFTGYCEKKAGDFSTSQITSQDSTSSFELFQNYTTNFDTKTSFQHLIYLTSSSTLNSNTVSTILAQTYTTELNMNKNPYSNLTLILSDIFLNFENLTDLIQILQNKSFIFDLKSTSSLPIDLLSSTKYDISDCISNCSNQGSCKIFNGFKFVCECNPNYSGSKCQTDLRPCSYNPCLNYLKCEDIDSLKDFKCECKNGFYGKRCENKINLCQNETCSGNGICQVIRNELFQNESIECKCFGIGQFEGEKFEIQTLKSKIRQTTIRTTYIIAIIILVLFYSLIFASDVFNYLIKKKEKQLNKEKKSKQKKETPKPLYYTP